MTNAPAKQRDEWSGRLQFMLACVGFAIGFGNVWRFPYLAYKNGGGAFILIYLLFAPLAGIPIYFLEVSMGQFMTGGCLDVWGMCPLFEGLGYAQLTVASLVNVYYCVILAWCFYYLVHSFQSPLPWDTCGNSWNTEVCRVGGGVNSTMATNATLNATLNATQNATQTTDIDSVVEFWERNVLGLTDSIEEIGGLQWKLVGMLVLSWVVVFFCIGWGIRSSGKVMYVTATTPYLLMIILLVYGCTLEGSLDGIYYYITPRLDRLMDYEVWIDAATQTSTLKTRICSHLRNDGIAFTRMFWQQCHIIYSYGVCITALNAVGSYNPWHRDSYVDCLLFSLVDAGTSLLAGFVMFPYLGYMAAEQGKTLEEVAESGPGLVFLVYPKAVTLLPAAPFWSIMFFLMLIMVGLDSQFVTVEGVVTALTDRLPASHSSRKHKMGVTALICFMTFLPGLFCVTGNGMYVFQVFDTFSASRLTLIICFLECLVVSYIYGADRYYDNLEMMFGHRISPYMKIMWKYVTPMILFVCFIFNFMTYTEFTYSRAGGEVYTFPPWAVTLGWIMSAVPISLIPLVMIIKICWSSEKSFVARVQRLLEPVLEPHQLRICDTKNPHKSAFLEVDTDAKEIIPLV